MRTNETLTENYDNAKKKKNTVSVVQAYNNLYAVQPPTLGTIYIKSAVVSFV